MKKKRLARTCDLDGSNPKVFELPPPRIIANLTHHPDGTCTAELTHWGKVLYGWHVEENFLKLLQAEAEAQQPK